MHLENELCRMVLLVTLLLLDVKATLSDYIQVNSNSGTVRGFRETVLDHELDIFLGIPYAIPPIGERRFKRPEMIHPWGDVKDATQFPNSCYQEVDTMFGRFEGVDMWNPNTPMSEDCLYLNIWTPSDRPFGKERAVLVWIFGGSFTSGSSSLDIYDGRILAAKGDVVVVSVNYRLGALGFLYQGNDDIPGNMGLLDQAIALQWIYNNIRAFGGDNRRITVFGESAGSASSSLLLLSPIARDFVTNVILMSGTAANRWSIDDTGNAKNKFTLLANLVGCHGDNTSVTDCLMEADPALLSEKTWYITDHSRIPTPLAPVVDGYFLLDHPKIMLSRGQIKRAGIMLGSVKDEGTYFMLYNSKYAGHFKFEGNEMSREEYIQTVGAVIETPNQALAELVNFQYTQPKVFSPNFHLSTTDFIEAIDDMITDTAFICSMLDYSNYQTAAGNSVYMYMFNHRTSVNPWPPWMGVMHGYEIDHVFGAPLNDSLGYQPEEKIFSETIIKYWTNFAKSGNPNTDVEGASSTSVEWPKYTSKSKDYLVLDSTNLHASQGLRDNMCTFWKEIFPPPKSQIRGVTCASTSPCLKISEFLVVSLTFIYIVFF